MQVTVTLEQRFGRAGDGSVWTPGQGSYEFLHRYLEVFDGVSVVARVQPVSHIPGGWKRADGARVSFVPVPYYVGPWQYLRRWFEIKRLLQSVAQASEAAILHAPSLLTTLLVDVFAREQHPYALEVVGDPWDVFAPGVIRHPLRSYFRARFSRDLRRECRHACATAYVTKQALQTRYPSQPDALSASYSDVELADEAFAPGPRPSRPASSAQVIMVGSLAQLYKAPDVLIDAAAICVRQGLDLRVTLVGDGHYRARLEAQAARLGLGARVHFAGQLAPGKDVRAELDKADLFVLPSRTEGLPRALIEAMARGLPCIGSNVGGIPELLRAEDLVPPGNAAALAHKMIEVLKNPRRLTAMSERNVSQARQFHETQLRRARNTFYEYVRGRTAEWTAGRRAQGSELAA